MPALDALHIKLRLMNDLDGQTWRNYAEYITDNNMRRSRTNPLHVELVVKNDGDVGAKTTEFTGDNDRAGVLMNRHLAIDNDEYSIINGDTTPEGLTQKIRRSLNMSETFYVSPDMIALVDAAASSYPLDEPVYAYDLPSPQGFIVIPNGLMIVDLRGMPCLISAMLWDTYGGRVAITFYVDRSSTSQAFNLRAISDVQPDLRARLPQMMAWSFSGFGLDEPLPTYDSVASIIPQEAVDHLAWHYDTEGKPSIVWSFDSEFDEADTPNVEWGKRPDAGVVWLLCALKLMQQTISMPEPIQVPRALQRRMERMKLANTKATVIELRKRKGDPTGEVHRQYTHRFLRRGHWRRQPYKNSKNEWERKMLWIHPTVVGDPSLPFVVRDHVNAFVR